MKQTSRPVNITTPQPEQRHAGGVASARLKQSEKRESLRGRFPQPGSRDTTVWFFDRTLPRVFFFDAKSGPVKRVLRALDRTCRRAADSFDQLTPYGKTVGLCPIAGLGERNQACCRDPTSQATGWRRIWYPDCLSART